jgi:hypothetical protein
MKATLSEKGSGRKIPKHLESRRFKLEKYRILVSADATRQKNLQTWDKNGAWLESRRFSRRKSSGSMGGRARSGRKTAYPA